jgi:CMP-N-acetylneuraminic acid synthetase
MKKTVAFFPIKLNNERTPGKNTKKFMDGTPLMTIIQRKLLQLKKDGILDEVYCFCSDESVCNYLLDGIEYKKRDKCLDIPETKGTDIYDAFVNEIEADVYVLCHATSPFVTVEHMKECIEKVKNEGYDSAFCAKKIQNFLWQNGKPMNFILNDPPRTQDMDPIYMELSTPYIFTRDTWNKFHSRSGMKPYICEAGEIEAIDIDYPEDFDLADIVYTYCLKQEG